MHIGVNYGLYDRNRLVNSIALGQSDESGDCFLAVENGSWHVAESLVIARYQMFSQVYFHPVRRAFDFHVEQATKEVLKNLKYKDGLFSPPTSEKNIKKYLEMDDWTIYGDLKNEKGGPHGDIILKREPYKCRKEWDIEPSKEEVDKISRDLERYKGFFDTGATTGWYKLDKDIMVYDQKNHKSYFLSYKSKLIEAMPGLPKVKRLFISQEGEGTNYGFKR